MPVRLDKQPDNQFDIANFFCNNNLRERVEAWCIRHALLLTVISIIVFLLAFVAICSALCGASATESGTVYNQFQNII